MKNRTFSQLTNDDRVRIEVLLKEGRKPSEIATRLGVNRSTVSREINGRSTPTGYHAWVATVDYETKRGLSTQTKT